VRLRFTLQDKRMPGTPDPGADRRSLVRGLSSAPRRLIAARRPRRAERALELAGKVPGAAEFAGTHGPTRRLRPCPRILGTVNLPMGIEAVMISQCGRKKFAHPHRSVSSNCGLESFFLSRPYLCLHRTPPRR